MTSPDCTGAVAGGQIVAFDPGSGEVNSSAFQVLVQLTAPGLV